MISIPRSFWHEFRGAFSRLPVWLPGTPVALGDVGLLDRHGWIPTTTTARLGIVAEPAPIGVPVQFDYRSHEGVEVSTDTAVGADTGAAVQARSALRCRFSRAGAFVMRAEAVRVQQIGNLADVEEQLLAAYAAGTWNRRWTVVTEVGIASSALVLVAADAGAEVMVELAAAVAPAAGSGVPFDMSASNRMRIAREQGMAVSFISTRRTALMWAGHGVRDPFVAAPSLRSRGEAISGPEGERPAVVEVTAPEWGHPAGPQ